MRSKLEKAYKELGKDFIKEMEAMAPNSLDALIVNASKAMQEAAEQLEANPKYQTAKKALDDCSAAKKALDKRQKAITRVALSLLNK